MPEDFFDDRIAARYDEVEAERFAPELLRATVDLLAGLAGDGAALELAIGTGRVALPLHERGVEIAGIDLSPAMTRRLRAKPGGADLDVTVGDMATTRMSGSFRLVFLVFNSITNLTTQDEQVACFANAAAHLEPGGCFVVEANVPPLQRLAPGETLRAYRTSASLVSVDEFDLAAQLVRSHHYWELDGRLESFSAPFRYVWPSELDLMARLAGMTLRHRWGDWHCRPFTAASDVHVSVWQLPT